MKLLILKNDFAAAYYFEDKIKNISWKFKAMPEIFIKEDNIIIMPSAGP